MDANLSVVEIRDKFAGEWVLIEDPETNAAHQILSGRVVCHSKDRDEIYRQAINLHSPRFAVLFTGTIPQDMAIVL